jgi:hypothetical protein
MNFAAAIALTIRRKRAPGRPHSLCNLLDLTLGRLTVVAFAGRNSKSRAFWVCRCACGRVKRIDHGSLVKAHRTGRGVRSCGCARFELARETRAARRAAEVAA